MSLNFLAGKKQGGGERERGLAGEQVNSQAYLRLVRFETDSQIEGRDRDTERQRDIEKNRERERQRDRET